LRLRNANSETARQCRKLKKLERLVVLTNGGTLQAESFLEKLVNDKQQSLPTETLEKAELELQLLRSNSALMSLCRTEGSAQQEQQIGGMIGRGEYGQNVGEDRASC